MLKSWFSLLYTSWCVVVLAFFFLLLLPFILLGSWLSGSTDKFGLKLAHGAVRLWAILVFTFIGMPIRVDWRFRPERGKAYVYCANHFSYIDIAVAALVVPGLYAFIGKISVRKIPLFGYMYAKLHVMVDRSSSQSRAYSLAKCMRTLAQGRSIVIFPEGGITAKQPPKMVYPFKDGAFSMAVQRQVPIVPITLVNNYRILPDSTPFRMNWEPVRVVFHEPISTDGLTQADVNSLREQAFQVIDNELHKDLTVRA
ncbi:lysophospholipid acyltransferase family protein [Fibrivirga algicola]|uniref:lysophospholipid acyltransferase family protein n=1 Tax=Fibrivirga algicola TaxID=2950420 RepID=UPI001E4F61BD|nr:lysophospholipid acyltransferase family protein [Fibrivirga algicola]